MEEKTEKREDFCKKIFDLCYELQGLEGIGKTLKISMMSDEYIESEDLQGIGHIISTKSREVTNRLMDIMEEVKDYISNTPIADDKLKA